jgi:hypothetical protein
MRTHSMLIVLAFAVAASANAEMKVLSQAKAAQILTDEYIVRSDKINRDFIIEVSKPDLAPGQKSAVIYATDGGFGLVGPASRVLMADGKIPKVHVVSIGYPNERGRHGGPRHLDLTHGRFTLEGRTIEGEGEAFEAFLMEEVRPFVESKYAIDPERSVLFGHSMGGLFVANVMLRNPDSFAGYLIGGIPIVGDPTLVQRAKAVAPRGNGRRVFVGYSAPDVLRLHSHKFAAPISGSDSKFTVMDMKFEDERHNSVILMLIAKGFRFLLPTDGSDRKTISVKPEVLDRYIGTFRFSGTNTIAFHREGKRLFGTTNVGEKFEFFPESETTFFARDVFAQITFEVGADGKVNSMKTRLNEADGAATRIK